MASRNAPRDSNAVPSALFENSVVPGQTLSGQIDQTTGRILVDMAGGTTGVQIAAHFQTDVFTSGSLQTTFVPSQTLIQDNGMYVNGSRQTPSTDYSIIGGDYVLNNGIPPGCAVVITYIY